jgi:mRNA interferase MazF
MSVMPQRLKLKLSAMSAPNPRRGQLWVVDWTPGRGSEQMGRRPALVIQTDAANTNPHYPNTIVLTVSTKGHAVTSHVEIQPSTTNGLREASFVKTEQVMTISKERLEKQLGVLDPADLARVAFALRKVLVL